MTERRKVKGRFFKTMDWVPVFSVAVLANEHCKDFQTIGKQTIYTIVGGLVDGETMLKLKSENFDIHLVT